jgi:hypothetical protein
LKLTTTEYAAVLRLAMSEGWQVLTRQIDDQLKHRVRRLTDGTFKDLAEVSSLQGEIRGLRWVLSFVNNRLEDAQEGE